MLFAAENVYCSFYTYRLDLEGFEVLLAGADYASDLTEIWITPPINLTIRSQSQRMMRS